MKPRKSARSRPREILLRCGLVVLGGLLAVLLAEGLLRLLGVSHPLPYVADPHTGSRLQPGFAGWFTKEGRAYVQINQAGFRDADHPLEKPPGTFRILVLGDSYVEALQVSQRATFWSILEEQLQPSFHRRGETVEVLAMGVSGWGTGQQLLALRQYGFAYDPDLVIVAFFAANDVRNNSRQLEGDGARPYFVLEQDKLRVDLSFRSDPRFETAQSPRTRTKVRLINASRLLQLIYEIRDRGRQRAAAADPAAGLTDEVFREPPTPVWREAWHVTEALLAEMHQECERREIGFWVALVNAPEQVHPPPAPVASPSTDWDYADRRIERLGDRLGFPVLPLAPLLRQYITAHREPVHGFANTEFGAGHWNETGHRVVGAFLAEQFLARSGAHGTPGDHESNGTSRESQGEAATHGR